MGSLSPTKQYNLGINAEKKTVLLVKPTDAFLTSIEKHQKNTHCSNLNISFDEHNGVIKIPTDNGVENYSFSLSDMVGKENYASNNLASRSAVCVQQHENGSLESLGSMKMKMIIRAKDDTYENTRFKVAAAEKQQKQFRAKEIKLFGSHFGQQVKKSPPRNTGVFPDSRSESAEPVKPMNDMNRPFISRSILSPKCDCNPSNRPASMPSISPGISSLTKPASSHVFPPFLKKENIKPKSPTEIQQQPLRERIVHLLAVRPYSRSEIDEKLAEEGLYEKDKRRIFVTLPLVSMMKQKHYHLSDRSWDEVQENWKFYSPEDAKTAQKNKQQHFEKKKLLIIQSSSTAKKPLPNEFTADFHPPNNKKQRISRVNGRNPETSIGSSNMHGYQQNSSLYQINQLNSPEETFNKNTPGSCRKSIDDISQSSGYVSRSSSQSHDGSFAMQSKKDPKYYILSHYLSGCNEEVTENSKLNSPKNSDQSLKQKATLKHGNENHPISFTSGNERKISNINPFVDIDSGFIKSKCERKESLKIILTHTPDRGFQIKKPKPSTLILKKDHKISRDKSSGTQKKVHDDILISPSVKQNQLELQPNNAPLCVTEHQLLSTIANKINFEASCSSMEQVIGKDEIHLVDSGKDLEKRFTKITSKEERQRYLSLYNAELPIANSLWYQVHPIYEKFTVLEKQYNGCEKESKEYQRIKERAYEEYVAAGGLTGEYESKRVKCNSMFSKLIHIKKLIEEYDSKVAKV